MNDENDFSKGHPLDTDLIEYETKVDFLTTNNSINFGLLDNGTLRWATWYEPFGSESKETRIPNTPFDSNIINLEPEGTLLSVLRSLNNFVLGYTGDSKSPIIINNQTITITKDDKIYLDPNYNLLNINSSNLKQYIKVSIENIYHKINVPDANIIIYIKRIYDNEKNFSGVSRLPNEEFKNIIIGLDFSIYKETSANPNSISRLSGIYKTDFLNVYNNSRWIAEVDDQIIDNPYFVDKINKNLTFPINFDDDYVGDNQNDTIKNKVYINPDKGYALSGIQYIYISREYRDLICDKPLREIVFAFDSIYNENAITKYYYLKDGNLQTLTYNPLVNINDSYKYNMGSNRDNKLFISNFDIFYNVVPKEKNIPKWMRQLAEFVGIFTSAPWGWKFDYKEHIPEDYNISFAGIKGILSVQTVKLKNTLLYDWIKDIDELKCCDTVRDNLYDVNTIEELYAKYVKDYYVSRDGIPSEKCLINILTPFCNNYLELEYTVDFGSENIENIFFEYNNTPSTNIPTKSLKSDIKNKINSILPNTIKLFDISSTTFTNIVIFTFMVSTTYVNSSSISFKIFNAQTQNEYVLELTNEKKILEGGRCKSYCSFGNTNCDNALQNYCLNEKDDDGILLKTKIKFNPKFYTIPNYNKEIEVYLPNQKRLYIEDKICGCYMASYKTHIEELTQFYNSIKREYQNLLSTETASNKEKIEKEIENIDYIIKTLVLNDGEESFKLALNLQLQNKDILDKYDTKCMFPPCVKSTFKTYAMKKSEEMCSSTKSCIGTGFAVPELNSDTNINCNMESGIYDTRCVVNNGNLEPKFTLLQDLKNYNQCKNTYKNFPEYTEVIKPSFCKIGLNARELGCDGPNRMKYVYDITVPQYPPNNSELCPPPKNQLPNKYPSYTIFSTKCAEPEVKDTPSNVKKLIYMVILCIIILFLIFFLLFKYK